MERPPELWSLVCESKGDFERWIADSALVREHRRTLADRQLRRLDDRDSAIYQGYCWVCGTHSHLKFDRLYSTPGQINWRERLVCQRCNLNTRLRLSLHIFEEEVAARKGDSIYLTEHLTPFAGALTQRGWSPMTSEFLPGIPTGTCDERGIRSEDLTRLTFDDSMFDVVLCFDVLEHLPDYRAALREIRRVVRARGKVMLTFPFDRSSAATLVRARIAHDGTTEHLAEPEYHGNPTDPGRGILCYYHFGWDILNDLRDVGFETATVQLYWSSDYGYIGTEQIVIIAT